MPPDTGASTIRRPLARTFSAMTSTARGGQVADRMTVAPSGIAANAPSPNRMLSACAALTTIRMSASTSVAASAAEVAGAGSRGRQFRDRVRAYVESGDGEPALHKMSDAMGSPMAPRPIESDGVHASFPMVKVALVGPRARGDAANPGQASSTDSASNWMAMKGRKPWKIAVSEICGGATDLR